MPSAWEALTSLPCSSRAATFARSFFSAAFATEADWASAEPPASKNTTSAAANSRAFGAGAISVLPPQRLKQLIPLPLAIAERVKPHSHFVEQRQVQVGQRRRFGEADVPAALHLPGGAAGDEDRKVVVGMPVGVAHAAAVQQERVVQERSVALEGAPHFRQERRSQRGVD